MRWIKWIQQRTASGIDILFGILKQRFSGGSVSIEANQMSCKFAFEKKNENEKREKKTNTPKAEKQMYHRGRKKIQKDRKRKTSEAMMTPLTNPCRNLLLTGYIIISVAI